MKNFIRKLFFRMIPPILVKTEIDRYYVKMYEKQLLLGEDSSLASVARVHNFSGLREKIRVGNKGLIMGELCVYKFGGEIVIGDNFFIGEGSRIWSGEKVEIGNDVLISHNVNIMDTNAHELDALERAERHLHYLKNGQHPTKGSIKTSAISIGNHSWIGFNATILKGVIIGEGAVVGACSVVVNDVEPWTVVGGNPAKLIKRLK